MYAGKEIDKSRLTYLTVADENSNTNAAEGIEASNTTQLAAASDEEKAKEEDEKKFEAEIADMNYVLNFSDREILKGIFSDEPLTVIKNDKPSPENDLLLKDLKKTRLMDALFKIVCMRYSVVGGRIRLIVQSQLTHSELMNRVGTYVSTLTVEKLMSPANLDADEDTASIVYSIYPVEERGINRYVDFASNYIKYIVRNRLHKEMWANLMKFYDQVASSGYTAGVRGHLFESVIIYGVLTTGVTIKIRNLEMEAETKSKAMAKKSMQIGKETTTEMEIETEAQNETNTTTNTEAETKKEEEFEEFIKLPPLKTEPFKYETKGKYNKNKADKVDENCLYFNAYSNGAQVDAVYPKEKLLFQMTVSEEHSFIPHRICELCELFNFKPDEAKFIFVTPHEDFTRQPQLTVKKTVFRNQKSKVNIKQYHWYVSDEKIRQCHAQKTAEMKTE